MKTIRAAIYRVGEEVEIRDVPDTLQSYQQIVDGRIDVATLVEDELVLVCNEEGIDLQLTPNRTYRFHNGETGLAFGDFFVCRTQEGEFAGLTDADIQRLPSLIDERGESERKIRAMVNPTYEEGSRDD